MYRRGGCYRKISVFFRLLTVRRDKRELSASIVLSSLSRECFCAAVIEKQLCNNGLPVPLGRDDTVGGLFCHRRLLSPGAKEGFPVAGKSLLVVGYSVLLCGGSLCLSPCPVFPRLDTVILPLLFKVSRRYSLEYCRW